MAESLRNSFPIQHRVFAALVLVCTLLPWLASANVTTRPMPVPLDDVPDAQITRRESFWPVYKDVETSTTLFKAVYPFYTRKLDKQTGEESVNVLWPLVRWKYEPEHWALKDRTALAVFPFWHSASAIDTEDKPVSHAFLIPFYWQGEQSGLRGEPIRGRYFVLFPFFWRAENARVLVPLFPPRPQNFTAALPFYGDFRGYWNRDRIQMILWPLFVKSEKTLDDGEKVTLRSFIWPIFGLYDAETVSGFRLWPLASRIKRPGEFTRGYWLWPLGQYRYEVDPDGGPPNTMTLFLPFYGKAHQPTFDYKMLFPFYGELKMKGRQSRGWAAAAYMEDDNLRQGIRHHRVLWFLIRWTTRIPVDPQFRADDPMELQSPGPMEGGGVFPLYLRYSNEKRFRQTIAWPFYHRRFNEYRDYTFDRRLLLPFWGKQSKDWKDGERHEERSFLFPIKRHIERADGEQYTSAPHLLPYSEAEALDRNWAPLWTVWSHRFNPRTGEDHERWLWGAWRHDREVNGSETTKSDFLIWKSEKNVSVDGLEESQLSILWGLLKRDSVDGEVDWKVLGR